MGKCVLRQIEIIEEHRKVKNPIFILSVRDARFSSILFLVTNHGNQILPNFNRGGDTFQHQAL